MGLAIPNTNFLEMRDYWFLVVCPECPVETYIFFLVDGKCHKCGCEVKYEYETNV